MLVQVVSLYKGKQTSANLPYKVVFKIPQDGKDVKLVAHLVSLKSSVEAEFQSSTAYLCLICQLPELRYQTGLISGIRALIVPEASLDSRSDNRFFWCHAVSSRDRGDKVKEGA